MKRSFSYFPIFTVAFLLTQCAPTYYQQHYNFNSEFEQGNLENALAALQQNQRQADGRSRFLYFVNNGVLLSILGRYSESNEYFEKAFLFGEDFYNNYFTEAASYFSNPMITTYKGEDHEHLMLLYFKALNFLKLGQPEQALVECRRLNIRLNKLGDKYTAEKKFQRDAFIHTLMGIIYQSTDDYNNAFIAYRNAAEIYENDYAKMFGMTMPDQLKKDLLNTAWWTGFNEEFEQFRTKFGMSDYQPANPEAELVFFWHNGLAPVKAEWSINFVITPDGDNAVVFSNESMNLFFPFHVDKKEERKDLEDLHVFRVAFPKYVERPVYFTNAQLITDTTSYPLELSEDINKIAFYSLEQRMTAELSKGLLRAAMKKTTEMGLRKEDKQLGAVLGVLNALTERADTRNWQTLPFAIYYSRVPLREGENSVKFSIEGGDGPLHYNFTYQAAKGETLFHTFSSLETSGHDHRIVGY